METKEIKEMLPEIPANQEQHFPQSDYLTHEQKDLVVRREALRLENHFRYRMKDKGMSIGEINNRAADIDWMAMVDVASVIDSANSRRFWQIQEQENIRQQKAQEEAYRNEQKKIWDANYFYQVIKRYFISRTGDFDRSNMEYIKAICFFLSEDPRFETQLGFSFRKGIMVIGTAGVGKTSTIQAVKDNPIFPISVYSLIDITEKVRSDGFCNLNTNRMILLDDVGSETELVKHYGTEINWFKEFIETYYLHNETYQGLIITTNCGGDELEAKYGYRVRSRIREMFNVIQLTGKDLRR
jgi:DNA replication protein DnaC